MSVTDFLTSARLPRLQTFFHLVERAYEYIAYDPVQQDRFYTTLTNSTTEYITNHFPPQFWGQQNIRSDFGVIQHQISSVAPIFQDELTTGAVPDPAYALPTLGPSPRISPGYSLLGATADEPSASPTSAGAIHYGLPAIHESYMPDEPAINEDDEMGDGDSISTSVLSESTMALARRTKRLKEFANDFGIQNMAMLLKEIDSSCSESNPVALFLNAENARQTNMGLKRCLEIAVKNVSDERMVSLCDNMTNSAIHEVFEEAVRDLGKCSHPEAVEGTHFMSWTRDFLQGKGTAIKQSATRATMAAKVMDRLVSVYLAMISEHQRGPHDIESVRSTVHLMKSRGKFWWYITRRFGKCVLLLAPGIPKNLTQNLSDDACLEVTECLQARHDDEKDRFADDLSKAEQYMRSLRSRQGPQAGGTSPQLAAH